MTSPFTPPMRTCGQCSRVRPVGEFRLKKTGKPYRSRQCRDCHNREERVRQARKRGVVSSKQITAMTNRLRTARSNNQVKAICARMIEKFGGVDALAAAWFRCWQTDLEKGRSKAFSHIGALIRLMQWAEANRPRYAELSDHELNVAFAQVIESQGVFTESPRSDY